MTDIRRTKLLTQPVDAAPDRLEAYRVEFPPGQLAGPHLHPGPVTGYVESGLIAFERDGHPPTELGPGDVFFEPAGETIRRFDNLSDREPATFIAFYLINGDQPLIQPSPLGGSPLCLSSALTRCAQTRPSSTGSAALSTRPSSMPSRSPPTTCSKC